jgi:phosphoglycerate-specific signal transduction histidine kinase
VLHFKSIKLLLEVTGVNYSMTFIDSKITEYSEQIENYKKEILRLNQLIQELKWQCLPNEDGDIASYDDIT